MELKQVYQKQTDLLATQLNDVSNIREFQDQYVESLVSILDLCDELITNMGRAVKNSEHSYKFIKKCLGMYHKIGILSVDELLENCIRKVAIILRDNAKNIGISLYPIEPRIEATDGGEHTGTHEASKNVFKTADKYTTCLSVLSQLGIPLHDLDIGVEEGDVSNSRKQPYYIIWVDHEGYQVTIAVNDEIGQATFVYKGILEISSFDGMGKNSMLKGTPGRKINYGDDYAKRLKSNIQTIFPPKIVLDPNGDGNLSDKQIGELTQYIDDIKTNLEDAGIYEIDGIWYFGDAGGIKSYQYLRTFPSREFNQGKKIGGPDGRIQSVSDLKKIFYELKLQIATPEQEKQRWASIILSKKDVLAQEAGVYYIDGIWYLGDINQRSTYAWLSSFPNCSYNKQQGIGDDKGQIKKQQHLQDMFESLGFQVATAQQEQQRWADKIVNEYAETLALQSHIYCIDDIWYFGDAKGNRQWSFLRSYPNTSYNKQHGIGDSSGRLSNIDHLKLLFQSLGLQVATAQQEKQRWADQIVNEYAETLASESNIYCIDDIWYFGNATASKYLTYFPNSSYNQANGLGDHRGAMSNVDHLKLLFTHLGLNVATLEEQKALWREQLLEMKDDIEKHLGIIYHNGIWDFSHCRSVSNWRGLWYFPSVGFNRQNGIGTSKGSITNKKQLEKMFQAIGFETQNTADSDAY